jgi:hypothetical protein
MGGRIFYVLWSQNPLAQNLNHISSTIDHAPLGRLWLLSMSTAIDEENFG